MLKQKDFKCPHMSQTTDGTGWLCDSRKSLFINIALHCADCGLYAHMMKKMEQALKSRRLIVEDE